MKHFAGTFEEKYGIMNDNSFLIDNRHILMKLFRDSTIIDEKLYFDNDGAIREERKNLRLFPCDR